MKYAIVNTDYERTLFQDIIPKDESIPKEGMRWEFIFFFINQAADIGLATDRDYPQDYLDYLQSLGLGVPKIKNSREGFNWFGQLKDLEVERKLNSKVWSYELLEKLGLKVNNLSTVNNSEEAALAMSKQPEQKWILKSPFRSSGAGQWILKSADELPNFTTPHLLEPFHERVADLVYHFSPGQEPFTYISKPTKEGGYRGGLIFKRQEELRSYIAGRGLSKQLNELEGVWDKVMNELQKVDLTQPLTLDSFIYTDGTENLVYPMCEINYRITMGTLLGALRQFLPENGVGEMIMLKNPQQQKLRDKVQYDKLGKTGMIVLTDELHSSYGVFLAAKDLSGVQKLKKLLVAMID